MVSKDKLVVIVGPTASGKSALAMEAARRYSGEIICADSRTVYKGMDIGTAKPNIADQREITHYMLDVVEPGESFTAADFKYLANQAIAEIRQKGKLAIMVGGTGLYIDTVLFDYQFGPPADPVQRAILSEKSNEELRNICRRKNIELPLNSNNKRHLVRAIELGGLLKQNTKLRENTIVVGIATDRKTLHDRIKKRAANMVQQGILEEVKKLSQQYGWDNEAMTGNIYRAFRDVASSNKDLETALEEVVQNDMQLAKRQMTWFKRNPHVQWSDKPQDLLTKIAQFVSSK